MKKHFEKIIPDKEKMQNSKVLSPIAHWLGNPLIWHFNRRAIIKGLCIGLFFGSLPILGQMLLAAIVAVVMRINMPAAVMATWISNPVSAAFLYTGNYYVGAWLMGTESVHLAEWDFSWESIVNLGGDILVPLFFGSVVVGVTLAVSAYIIMQTWWRLHVVSIHKERQSRPGKRRSTEGKPNGDA